MKNKNNKNVCTCDKNILLDDEMIYFTSLGFKLFMMKGAWAESLAHNSEDEEIELNETLKNKMNEPREASEGQVKMNCEQVKLELK